MSTETTTTTAPAPAGIEELLRRRGFARNGRAFHNGELALIPAGRWYALFEQTDGNGEVPPGSVSGDGLGLAGFWKCVQTHGPRRRVFEIPCWVIEGEVDMDGDAGVGNVGDVGDDGGAPLGRFLDWALATRGGEAPPGWDPPDADLVSSWCPRGALTVQAGGCVRQIERVLGGNRWALRVPIVSRLAPELSEPRRAALRRLAAEAQQNWAMVRLGISVETGGGAEGASAEALIAEVDFTGAPHSELLFSAGLDVLRHGVAWLVETADVLADPVVAIASVASAEPTPRTPMKGENHEHHGH